MARPILRAVVRRLGALIIAVIVAAAPSALTACELMCAQQAAAPSAPAHTCHDTPPADEGGPVVSAAPHACGHVSELPSASAKLSQTSHDAMPAVSSSATG